MNALKNLNFTPIDFKEKELNFKIKKYEKSVLILWMLCLIAFVSFLYNKNRNEKILETYNIGCEENLNNMEWEQAELHKNIDTLASFKKFMLDFRDNLNYSSMEIKDNIINMTLSVSDKAEYFNIIKNVEKLHVYRITFLSPLSYEDEKFKFKLSLEVKL